MGEPERLACGQSVELRGGVLAFHNAGEFHCDASGSPGEIGGGG